MATPLSFVAGTATAVAPVAAPPTTAAHFLLWNGEPSGGKVYRITAVGWTTIVSAGAAFVGQLMAHNGVAPVSRIPSVTTANGPSPLGGGLGITTLAKVGSAGTIVNDGVWHVVGDSVNAAAATATIALGGWQKVDGLYLVQPGGIFSLAVLCSAAASATCACYVTWVEN